MAEQLQQSMEFSRPIYVGEWRVYDIGAETLNSLFKEDIINEPSNKIKNKKPDALIVNSDKEIVVYVESKKDSEFSSKSKLDKAIKQELYVAKMIHAKIYIVRDSNMTVWINPKTGNEILDTHGNPIRREIRPKSEGEELEKLIKKILVSISENNDKLLKEETLDPSDLAKKVHQKLYVAKGISPSTALYTFVELFLFKYLSDLNLLKGIYSFEHLYSLYDLEGTDPLDVLKDYLSNNGAREQMKTLFVEGSDKTSIINGDVFHEEIGDAQVFKSILDIFKKYEEENGKFININRDFKSKLFESFLKEDLDSKKMGQFFTPLTIVDNMVRMISFKENMEVCDPACGVGKFLLEAIKNNIDDFYSFDKKSKEFKSKIKLTGYDKYSEDNGDKTIILAKANSLIYFSKMILSNPSKEFAKSFTQNFLNESFELKYSSLGSLEKKDTNKYDVILANPPYIVNGSRDIKKLASDYTWNGLGIESLFMEWIVDSLKPGGIANIVIPDGLLANEGNKNVRNQIKDSCYVKSIISLPNKAFFNTQKKTYILTLEKRKDESVQTEPIFSYICSTIGESLDKNRFIENDNDLKDAVDNYNIWKSSDTQITSKIIEDRSNGRFKMLNPEKFLSSESWIIENDWSLEEKIQIGLVEKDNSISVDGFKSLLKETLSLIEEVQEEIKWIQ